MLDSHGFLARPIVGLDKNGFLDSLQKGTRTWFHDRMEAKLGQPLDAATKELFDPATPAGIDRIFAHRNDFPQHKEAISYVVQGDSKLGLARMEQSWARSGFGKWAHLNPGFCMRLSAAIKDKLCNEEGIQCFVSGPPHLIYKPPMGAELAPHHDQFAPKELLQALRQHVKEEDTSTTAWVKKFGFQCLAHIDGGRVDGSTYIIGPMTPQRLLICLEAFADGRVQNVPSDFFDRSDGPHFLKWKSFLPALNHVLEEKNEQPLSVMPMVCGSFDPFMVIWPVGFPHGSAKNKHPRVTSTVCLSMKPPTDRRFLKRARCMADLGDNDKKMEAETWLKKDVTPYEEGRTHKKPHLAARWVRPNGFYAALAPTHEDVDVMESACD